MHADVSTFMPHAQSYCYKIFSGRSESKRTKTVTIPQGCHCCKSSASDTSDKKLLLPYVNRTNHFDIFGRSQIKLYDDVVLKYLFCCHFFVFGRNEYLQRTRRKEWDALNCFHLINFFGKNLLSAFT